MTHKHKWVGITLDDQATESTMEWCEQCRVIRTRPGPSFITRWPLRIIRLLQRASYRSGYANGESAGAEEMDSLLQEIMNIEWRWLQDEITGPVALKLISYAVNGVVAKRRN